jgi:hemoglobin-like flavoprotein
MKSKRPAVETRLKQGARMLCAFLAPETAMHSAHVDAVRHSFGQVALIAPQAAALFYDNLFAADPSLRALFKSDLSRQGERLMAMIGKAVGMLDKPAALLPVLRSLGARHAEYGVVTAHYATVGAALMKTLAQGLGAAWTPETQEAWATVYGVIRDTMLEGAASTVEA